MPNKKDQFYDGYLTTKNHAVQTLHAVKGIKEPEPATIKLAAMAAVRAELECIAYQLNNSKDTSLNEDALPNLISLISCAADMLSDDQKAEYWKLLNRTSGEVVVGLPREKLKVETGDRITIPAAQIEYREGQNTIWVHSAIGATILRIQTAPGKKIHSTTCKENPVSHADINVPSDITVCLASDAEVNE